MFHPGFGYFADAYGLKQEAVEAGGRTPAAKQLRVLIEQARADGVKTIFVQPQFAPQSAQVVAEAIGGEGGADQRAGEGRREQRRRHCREDRRRTPERDAAETGRAQQESLMTFSEPVISLRDVSFSYGGEPALEDVNSVGCASARRCASSAPTAAARRRW